MPVFDDLTNVASPEAAVGTTKLIWDKPDTEGKKNVLRRAERLLNYQWKPLRKIAQNTLNGLFCIPERPAMANEIRIGLPYSYVRMYDRFIGGHNVPLNGFRYAVENPFSDFYLRYLQDCDEPYFQACSRYSLLFYGAICSSFCHYALNIPMTVPINYYTYEWDDLSEMMRLENQNVQAVKLCDTIVTVNKSGHIGGHIRMITGIGRDETGKVCEIELSEGTEPHTVTIHHTASQFTELLVSGGGNYYIYRCKTVDETEDPEEAPLPVCPDVLMSMIPGSLIGGDDPVCFAMTEKSGTLVVASKEHTFTAEVKDLPAEEFNGKTYYLWKHEPLPTGEYKVFLRKDGKDGIAGDFAVANVRDLQPKKDGKPLPLHAWRLCTEDGALINAHSDCLYEGGALKASLDIFLTDGEILTRQKIALKKYGSTIRVYPASALLNADGKLQKFFPLKDDTVFYTYLAAVGESVEFEYTAPDFCENAVYSWGGDGRLLQSHTVDPAFSERKIKTVIPYQKFNLGHFNVHLYRGHFSLPLREIAVYCKKSAES